ncbi:MAG: Tex family protein [Thermodesulfobacteriota bacterium]
MNLIHIEKIARELTISISQINAVGSLLEEGATIPFIARYRKEATGSLDEVAITSIRDRLAQLAELDERRQTVLKSLEQHGHLTPELEEKVRQAETMAVLEDIYLPFKPKRRTRGMIAREKGLAPLAEAIFSQTGIDPEKEAPPFVNPELGVADIEAALSGARDIIAEIINEDEQARTRLRNLFATRSIIKSTVVAGKEEAGAKYRDYFEWEEPAAEAPSHRILAIRRGEREDILNMSVQPPVEEALCILETLFVRGEGRDSQQVKAAAHDAYKRLLSRSMETEIRVVLKDKADREAIHIFADNLRQLLLAPPLGARRVMGIDPGFRTGCKTVCLDRQGKLLHHETVYLHLSESQAGKAAETLLTLCRQFEIEAIAIGNGTAGRETEAFVRSLPFPHKIQVVMVNESGASIYSASEAAREEFPDLDLTVRGSVSIARRLMDPLSELVKIDPKSIGVGQYQHDVDQTALKQSLDDVVMSCVNGVGVDINRASTQLLTYVSGLGPQLARNIVAHRDANGPFTSRRQLKNISRLGPKAFEQSAGFLRIRDGENPLDASAVHPESYHIVDAMAADLGCSLAELMNSPELRRRIDLSRYASETIGMPTLKDILAELEKPGRDPREEFEEFGFASNVTTMEDLVPGMRLPGIVTNITAFGAFVDIGVHQDGLVHVSQLADHFVKDPAGVVKVHQKVTVTVLEVDPGRRRIALSMKSNPDVGAGRETGAGQPRKARQPAAQPVPASKKRNERQPFNNPFADALNKLR